MFNFTENYIYSIIMITPSTPRIYIYYIFNIKLSIRVQANKWNTKSQFHKMHTRRSEQEEANTWERTFIREENKIII